MVNDKIFLIIVVVFRPKISGFTAWSSEREPSQVFTLLESIYRQMDRAAKKLGVFKVCMERINQDWNPVFGYSREGS